MLKGTYKIDPEKTPKTIDIHYENLEIAQGRIMQGIYVLEGDTLKTCFAWSGPSSRTDQVRESDVGREAVQRSGNG